MTTTVLNANKSYMAKEEDMVTQHKWYLIDANGKILGRMATRIATILMGKHKPTYTPHVDTGDFVVVVNAEKIKLTGKKPLQKTYQTYSGYADGRHTIPFNRMMAKAPTKIVELAVKRMIPATRLGHRMFMKLKIYTGPNHPHQAQQPIKLEI